MKLHSCTSSMHCSQATVSKHSLLLNVLALLLASFENHRSMTDMSERKESHLLHAGMIHAMILLQKRSTHHPFHAAWNTHSQSDREIVNFNGQFISFTTVKIHHSASFRYLLFPTNPCRPRLWPVVSDFAKFFSVNVFRWLSWWTRTLPPIENR